MQVEEKHLDFDTTKYVSANKEELPCHLQAILGKIARKEGYANYEILSRSISTEGGNYMASLYEVDIKGKTKNGEKETNMFIKHIISQEHVNIVDVSELYAKELFFYNELSKVFTELENEADVPVDERYKSVKSYNDSNTDAIILQNLAKEGFITVYRMNVMPLRFAELSVQQLAKFHSLSWVIERKRPEFFEKKIKTVNQSIQYGDNFNALCTKMYNDSTLQLNSETKKKLDSKLPKYIQRYTSFLNGGETKIKCLCHGDYRMNNILMKTTEHEITEVIPVDYQLLVYGSPIIDFLYFIFASSDREFRRNHLTHLKDMYFDTMEKYLKYFDIDIHTLYPRKHFERDYYHCLDYGLLVMLFLAPFFFTLEDEVPDLDKTDLTDIKVNLDHRFLERLNGVIEDMIDWGKF